jgi:uncharacterized surface protein with fasciclin (FAS1) repeats
VSGRQQEEIVKKIYLALIAMLLVSVSAFAGHRRQDIVGTAIQAGTFNTLAQALQAAGLVDTLQGPGPFTVFAPTDKAFASLPRGTLEVLLKPENKEQLRSILAYHVVPGRVTASDIRKTTSAKTVNGQELRISFLKGVAWVNDSRVTRADMAASNGIIHVVDKVMLPKMGDITQVDKVADLLAEFESRAIETRRDAARLESKTRGGLSWQSHSQTLNLMKDHVNDMGKMLAELEALKPQATLLQAKAIECARPHLQAMADGVESAITALNEDRRMSSPEYKATLHGVWTSADRLYRTVDTIIDYHEARNRMSSLLEEPVTR